MTEISRNQKLTEWICRILITIDLYFSVAGYISFYQAKHQLVTPLIPRSILYELTESYMKAALATSVGLLAGLWLYFFNKKTIAIILLCLAGASYEIILLLLNK